VGSAKEGGIPGYSYGFRRATARRFHYITTPVFLSTGTRPFIGLGESGKKDWIKYECNAMCCVSLKMKAYFKLLSKNYIWMCCILSHDFMQPVFLSILLYC
jgi:hypothetical protein